jgi:hypothetical protein
MPELLTRKDFLRKMLHELAGLSREVFGNSGETGRLSPEEHAPDPLLSDFSPALLAEEACRLGLDPRSMDRDQVLEAIRRRMQEQFPGS